MRKIVITSGKGGVGKTTVTAALGRRLALDGHRVVLVDGDVGLNNLDVVVGIENRVVYDIGDVLLGKCRLPQALVEDKESNMKVLPSSACSRLITPQAFRGVVDSLHGFDYVLIDCPAGIEDGFHRAVSSADEAIVVTTPSASAIRDADKVISLLSTYRFTEVSLVINRMRYDMVSRGEMLKATDIGNLLHTPVIGVVPEDDCITLYQQLGRTIEGSTSAKSIKLLAGCIETCDRTLVEPYLKRRRFWR